MLLASAWFAWVVVAVANSPTAKSKRGGRPNILFFLTDDQDKIIGGWDKMEKTKALLGGAAGAEFSNAIIHTPICAVSRSALQSGRYLQNIKSNDLPTPVSGHGSAGNGGQHHVNYSSLVAPFNFGKALHDAGYVTGMFGKWMNEFNGKVGNQSTPQQLNDVAPGWDRWFAGMGYGNLTYLDSESPTGTYVACPFPQTCAAAPHQGYTTSIIGNKTVEWLRSVVGRAHSGHSDGGDGDARFAAPAKPFFAYVAVTAPHLPNQPPPWYCPEEDSCPSVWPTANPPKTPTPWYKDCAAATSPRFANFDFAGPGFHSGIANQTKFTDEDLRYVDKLAVMRCLTLLGVDDTVAGLSAALDALGVADNTYFIYTSDHGYNLGHHRLPDNKFNSYMHDLRIPFLIRGPGISGHQLRPEIITQVDFAPTFLGLAGLPTPARMDGRSLVPLVITATDLDVPASVASHWHHETACRAGSPWREHSLTVWYNCGFSMLGHDEDDASNTFLAMYVNSRALGHWKYAEFDPTGKQTSFAQPNFYELFDMDRDVHETQNLFYTSDDPRVTAALKATLHTTLRDNYACSGVGCP